MFSTKDVLLYREQKHPPASNPTECLAHLLRSELMTDLTIIIPGHSDNFKVHSLVLSMWSNVFQAMLFGPMAEPKGNNITLAEDPPEAFKWLINYMYTGQTMLPSLDLALEVYLLANKYLMDHLKTVCSKYLIDAVRATSVPEVLNIASLMEDDALISKCAEVLGSSPDSFFSSPTLGSLSSDSLKQLLTKDVPVSSESVIFKGILNWGKEHLKSKEGEISTVTLRQEVEKFLPQVNFLTMTLEEFVKHVLPESILTLKEVESILQNIANVPGISLPPCFSTRQKHRNIYHISLLETCHISRGTNIVNFGYRNLSVNSEVPILGQIEFKNEILLSKIEYKEKLSYGEGMLQVCDSNGVKYKKVDFDGQVAMLDVPIRLMPGTKYTFTLSGGSGDTYYDSQYSIKDNNLVSGRMMNSMCGTFNLYYWK